jgi:hypothetical protein
MPLQSRKTPRKGTPPQPAAHDPPSKPKEWLTPPFKDELLATNTNEPFVKNEDVAKTSMLINREALTENFSPSRTSSPGVVSRLVASLSGRTNVSPSASPKTLLAGAEETSLVVMVALARKASKIPRQKSAIPITRSRKARTPPTPTLSSPRSLF